MDINIDFIFTLLINLFELYIVYRFMNIFFETYNIDKRLVIIAYSFRWLGGTLINDLIPYPIVSLIFFIGSTFLIALCYHGKVLKKILISLIIFMCGFISELLFAIIIELSGFNMFEKEHYGSVLLLVGCKIIFWIISLILQKFKGIKLNTKLPKVFVIAVIIILGSSFIIEMIIMNQNTFESSTVILSLFLVLATTLITIYLYDSYSKIFQERAQAELVKREQGYYQKQSELLQKNHEELRQFRHDIQNRIITMQEMIQNQDYEQVLNYTEQITQRIQHVTAYSETNHIAVDSIINYKLTLAEQKGIQVKSKVQIPEELVFNEDDIVVILGNLLDNAIEACEKLDTNKYIHLLVDYNTGTLTIQTKNNFDSVIHSSNGQIVTRKDDSIAHGIGLKSIKNIVDRYNGQFDIDYTKTQFDTFIMLYIAPPTQEETA